MAGQAVIEIGGRRWAVSLATTPGELVRGLGGLASIPPGTGMLFDMGREQIITVTTAPMLFPLDIVFLDGALRVNGLARDVAPGYLVTGDVPARFFLEVNAGEAGDVRQGDRAVLSQVPPAGQLGASQSPPPMGQVVSLTAGVLTLGLVWSLLRSLARGLFGPGGKAGQTLSPHVIASENRGSISQDQLDGLQGLLDEDKKTESLKKLESALGKLTPEQRQSIDGLDDLKKAIEDYRGITRQGLTPEDYIEEKESAWGEIEEALGNLAVWDGDEGERRGMGTEAVAGKTVPASPSRSGSARREEAASKLDFFADSSDHCCRSVDGTGIRPQLDEAFRKAIARVKGGLHGCSISPRCCYCRQGR